MTYDYHGFTMYLFKTYIYTNLTQVDNRVTLSTCHAHLLFLFYPPQNDVRYDDDELMQLYEYYRKLEHRLAEQQRIAANRKDYY